MSEVVRTDDDYAEEVRQLEIDRKKDRMLAVVAPSKMELINRIMSGLFRGDVFTSLPSKTRDEQIKLYGYETLQGNDLQRMANGESVNVCHIVLCHAEFSDDDGQVKTGAKLVLIDTAGNGFVILSQTFIKSFASIIQRFSPLPFDPPLTISATETKMGGGKRYYLPKVHP